MRALGSSFGSWRLLERQEGTSVPHSLTFPLAVVEAIGRPHGLMLTAEEETTEEARSFDAIFVSVMDSRCLFDAPRYFRQWQVPPRRTSRTNQHPLVVFGGQATRNPTTFYDVADVIVVGDAEDPLPLLLKSWQGASRAAFLRRAADIPGVLVPWHHAPDHPVVQSVAEDIGVTLRSEVTVSLDGSRRMEIARGCRYKCTFCSLGWRQPLRENSAADVIGAIRRSPRKVHLQAGDAESHTGITELRRALDEHDAYDQGWTGRLDTLLQKPTTTHAAKRYAFGVEGVSYRLRAAVGKRYLTDDRLINDTCAHLEAIQGDSKGRAAWHLIAGLPGTRPGEWRALIQVLRGIQREYKGKHARNLSLHWQPFSPLPGTPMQYFGVGHGAGMMAQRFGMVEGGRRVRVRNISGRTDGGARCATLLARADQRAVRFFESSTRLSAEHLAELVGATWGELDPDICHPWDHVVCWASPARLRRAYKTVLQRLSDT
jgi:hypothetical protein